ncbi:MAG TPA: thioesterase family protein [Nevskia sp.]|jgi:acyl-CoA thioesterase|nr:thioesterase family protein [Nevskia sp.]
MLFSEVLGSVEERDGAWTAAIPDSWAQGRTSFGGLLAALAVRAMRGLVPSVPLRVLQTTFIAPVPAGTVRIEARVLRSGKSATHVEAWLYDRDQPACLVVAIFGAARESAIQVELPPPGLQVTPEQARPFPWIEGVTPAFTRNTEMRWASGKLPFTGATEPKTQIYVGFRNEPFAGNGLLGESQLIGYADIIPSPGISLLRKPAPASSLTWTLEILTDDYGPARPGLWLMDAEVSSGRQGYLSQSATLWSPEWKAFALSRQSVVAFG